MLRERRCATNRLMPYFPMVACQSAHAVAVLVDHVDRIVMLDAHNHGFENVDVPAIRDSEPDDVVGFRQHPSTQRNSQVSKKRHLERAHEFYEKYGGKTVILARFVPIIRTFCPPVAGAAKMSYSRYLLYDVFGGFLWVWSMTLLGYTLGRSVPNIDKRIHIVIAAVVVASLLPAAYSAWKARSQAQAIPPTHPKAEEE